MLDLSHLSYMMVEKLCGPSLALLAESSADKLSLMLWWLVLTELVLSDIFLHIFNLEGVVQSDIS